MDLLGKQLECLRNYRIQSYYRTELKKTSMSMAMSMAKKTQTQTHSPRPCPPRLPAPPASLSWGALAASACPPEAPPLAAPRARRAPPVLRPCSAETPATPATGPTRGVRAVWPDATEIRPSPVVPLLLVFSRSSLVPTRIRF